MQLANNSQKIIFSPSHNSDRFIRSLIFYVTSSSLVRDHREYRGRAEERYWFHSIATIAEFSYLPSAIAPISLEHTDFAMTLFVFLSSFPSFPLESLSFSPQYDKMIFHASLIQWLRKVAFVLTLARLAYE